MYLVFNFDSVQHHSVVHQCNSGQFSRHIKPKQQLSYVGSYPCPKTSWFCILVYSQRLQCKIFNGKFDQKGGIKEIKTPLIFDDKFEI